MRSIHFSISSLVLSTFLRLLERQNGLEIPPLNEKPDSGESSVLALRRETVFRFAKTSGKMNKSGINSWTLDLLFSLDSLYSKSMLLKSLFLSSNNSQFVSISVFVNSCILCTK